MPDRTLEILLKLRSDVGDLQKVIGGLTNLGTTAENAAKSGFGLKQAFEFAGANEVLHRLVETLNEVPRQFVECIKQGVEFNAELQRVQTSIAGIFRQQAPDKFPTFEKAKQAAAETIDLLKAKANELGVAYTDMFETYQHAQALLSAGGISNVRQQIDVIALLNRAMQSLGVNATSAARDISDLLQGGGKAAQTLGVPRLASLVHMTTEEFLQWIETSKQAGTLAEDLQSKFGGLASGMAATGQTFDAQTTRMQNAIFDLKQAAAGPIMDPLTEAIQAFTRAIQDADTKTAASNLGKFMREFAADALLASAGWDAIAKLTLNVDKNLLNALPGARAFASLFGGGGAKPPGETFDLREFLESGLNRQREKGNALEVGKSKILTDQTAQLELQQQIEDQLNLSRAQASGDTEAVAQERATSAADKAVAAMKTKHVTQLEINGELLNEDKVWRAIYDATYNQIGALAAGKQSHEDITSLLREQETVLQNIRQQENLISQNPFLSADAKDAQLANLYLKEQAILLVEIEKVRAKIKEIRGLGDPAEQAEVAELNQKLQSLEFTLSSITQKFQTTGFMGGLQKELADWVNNFGTSAHQIAGLIEGSINVSLQAMNDLIINGQGNVVDLEKKLLGMFLTMLEQMALQQAASLLGITTTTSAQVAAGGAIAAAHAPAAAATSISSYGAAALIGEVAAIAAIIAIMAALGGGFKRGGFTGPGHEDEVAGPAHKGEFYFSKRETESIGLGNLYALKHSAPRFGAGGRADFIYPPWTFGPSGPRTGYQGPTADADWMRSHGTRFSGLITGGRFYPPIGNLDDDVPPADLFDPYAVPTPAPRIVVVSPSGLPVGPGGLNEGPGLFPGPAGGVTITTAGGEPYPGGYSFTPNYPAQFGGDLSLGENLFTSLGALGYGTGYPFGGGNTFLVTTAAGTSSFPGVGPDPVAPGNVVPLPDRNFGLFIDPATGMTMRIVGHDTATGNAVFQGPGGQLFVGPGTGHAPGYIGYGTSDMARADAMLMASQAYGGTPNSPGQGDAGPSRFYSGVFTMDPEGGFSPVGQRNPRDPRWILPSQGESARLGLSFSGQKYNDWLVAHNPWAYGVHGADGTRIAGPASRADNILAWLSTGERVVPADRNIFLERKFGFDWDKRLELAMPRLASGGRVGGTTAVSSPNSAPESDVHVYIFDDRRKAQRAYEESPHARKVFRDRLNRYS